MSQGAEGQTSPFWQRKGAERALLEQYAVPGGNGAHPADLATFLASGRDLRERILQRQLEWSVSIPETSELGRVEMSTPAGLVSYSYQRYDLRILCPDWLELIHARPCADGRTADGLFLASGMSAVTVAMSVAARIAPDRASRIRVEISRDPYFEVQRMAGALHPGIELVEVDEFTGSADVVWLDTISSSWPDLHPGAAHRLSLVVIDSSCVEPDSPVITGWLTQAAQLAVPVLLVRSHIKLDALGLEVARLGSAVVTGTPADVERISALMRETSSLQGLTFSLLSTYPWLGVGEFVDLARARADGIRASTRRLVAALVDASVPVLPRVHETSVVVPLPQSAADLPANTVAGRIVSRAQTADVPVSLAGSFALDQLAVHDYTDLRTGRQYLRLCGADLPEAVEDTLADAVARETAR